MHLPAPGAVPVPSGLEDMEVVLFSSVGIAEAEAETFADLVGDSGFLHVSTTEDAPAGVNFASYRCVAGVHLDGKSEADEPWVHYRLELTNKSLEQDTDEEWATVWPQLVELLAEHGAVFRFSCRAKRDRVDSIVQPLVLPHLQGFTHMAGCRFAKTKGDRPDGEELYSLLVDHGSELVQISGRIEVAVSLDDSLFEEPWKQMRWIMENVVEFQW